MIWKCASAVLACLACGCIDLRVESPEDILTTSNHFKNERSVAVDEFSGIRPRIVQTEENRGLFSLECTGKFRVAREETFDSSLTGRRAISVGLFPGAYWACDAVDGTDYSEWPLYGLEVVLANGFMAGIPTLLSLFYEPFDAYHDEKCSVWSALSGYGLMGCSKRSQRMAWTHESKEFRRSEEPSPTYVLSDYTVCIAGLDYRCESGSKSVAVTIPSEGETVSVRIETVPTLKGNLHRYVSSLAGAQLEVEIERNKRRK